MNKLKLFAIWSVMVVLLIAGLCFLYVYDYMVASIVWLCLLAIALLFLLFYKGTNEFYRKNKWWIILGITAVNVLDLFSTYYIAKKIGIHNEINVLMRWIVTLFGINLGLIILFFITTWILITAIKNLDDVLVRPGFFVILLIKTGCAVSNFVGLI